MQVREIAVRVARRRNAFVHLHDVQVRPRNIFVGQVTQHDPWSVTAAESHIEMPAGGDCLAGVTRWNKILERHGFADRLRLPDRKFNRGIGMFSSMHFDPSGTPLSEPEWARRKHEWLPAPSDREYLLSIMATPVYEPGKFANYIAPPVRGINRQPIDFEYVRTEA